MKVQGNYTNLTKGLTNGLEVGTKPSFKAGYVPKKYIAARELADAIYDHSTGVRKWLLKMERSKGEMQNNTVTAIGTAGVAPIFIAFNPFSKEDTNSKKYTACRQFVSAPLTWGVQYFVMGAFNNWLDKHAAYLGVDEIDLKAKPPVSTLKPTAKQNWHAHYADCLNKGIEPGNKKNWIKKEIIRLQDEAFYKTLRELRENDCNGKVINIEDVVKMDMIKDKRKEFVTTILKDEFHFTDSQLSKIKDYNGFVSGLGEKICKQKELNFEDVKERIDSVVMKSATDDMKKIIAEEVEVKLQTSKHKQDMMAELKESRKSLLDELKNSTASNSDEIFQRKYKEAAKVIYNKKIESLRPGYEAILAKESANLELTAEEKIKKFVFDKLAAHVSNPIEGLKNHGTTKKAVERSVMIKKYLINHINKSEAKFKGWKDRSGVIIGLFVMPITCTILNWVFPRFMNEFFPKLSAAKAASKEKSLGVNENNKEAKEVK